MASMHIVWMRALQSPFPFGNDEQGRVQYSCNFLLHAYWPVDGLERCVAKLLQDAGLGTIGTTIFSSAAVVPNGDGPFTSIVRSGGLPPDDMQSGEQYENPSFQLVVRGKNVAATESRAVASWRALHNVTDTDVSA